METLFLISIFLLTLLLLLYKRATRHYGYLESLGIPVVAPTLCFGSGPFAYHNVLWHENPASILKGGVMTAGKYEGSTPAIYTVDPEVLKEVLVTQFNSFRSRDHAMYPEVVAASTYSFPNERNILTLKE